MGEPPQVVVVGVDRSPTSILALEQALLYAQGGADVHCIQVVEPDDLQSSPSNSDAPLDGYRRQLQRLVSDVQGDGETIELHVGTGSPAEQISSLAEKLDADLVIVGTHGRRGFSRLWMGSCAEAVVRRAPCPVLVVRPKLAFGSSRPRKATTTIPPSSDS
jgi:nucleotide-binding universal stress UspA family protein